MESNEKHDVLFVYGILKRKFSLDLEARGGSFLGEGAIEGATLRPIGSGVGLKFDQDCAQIAHGEVFLVPKRIWPWLDYIENNGHTYTRVYAEINLLDPIEKSVSVITGFVYEHTYPGMAYASPIPGGRYKDPSHVLSLAEEMEDNPRSDVEWDPAYEFGGEA